MMRGLAWLTAIVLLITAWITGNDVIAVLVMVAFAFSVFGQRVHRGSKAGARKTGCEKPDEKFGTV